MKSPPRQYTDYEARERTEAFIANGRRQIWRAVPLAKPKVKAGAAR
jgi:hypothetical protein